MQPSSAISKGRLIPHNALGHDVRAIQKVGDVPETLRLTLQGGEPRDPSWMETIRGTAALLTLPSRHGLHAHHHPALESPKSHNTCEQNIPPLRYNPSKEVFS